MFKVYRNTTETEYKRNGNNYPVLVEECSSYTQAEFVVERILNDFPELEEDDVYITGV